MTGLFKKIAAFVAASAALILSGLGFYRQQTLNASSEAYAIETALAILSEGPERLLQEASEAYRRERTEFDVADTFTFVRNALGEVELIADVSGSADVPLWLYSPSPPRADYDFTVTYAGGPAQVLMGLEYQAERWQVTRFRVVSNLLSD